MIRNNIQLKKPRTYLAFIGIYAAMMLLISCTAEKEEEAPTIYIIGDSTVRNGSGSGSDGLWGWGSFIHELFDTNSIHIENHAIGGRSSRTFLTEGRWDRVKDSLKAGDYVLMQLGHNDGGPYNTGRARASLKGTGNESIDVIMEADSSMETVYTYGWYMRKYIKETQAAGATPIVFSPVPRNRWDENGEVYRAHFDYGLWAKQVAEEEGAYFIDLNDLVSLEYERIGMEETAKYFPKDHTHTNKEGAILNAEIVVKAIRDLEGCKLEDYMK